jgi:hypothetical protein
MKNSSSLARTVVLIFTLLVAGLMIVDARNQSQSDQNKQALEEVKKMIAGREDEPAETVFKNIEILKGKKASRLPGMMSALTGLLGVDCAHCHTPQEWEKETPAKQTARKHFDMLRVVNTQLELQTNGVTCWTCHRGKPQPEPPPPDAFKPTDEMIKQAEQDKRPVQEVYKNIQSLKGVPAGRWMIIMTMFTRSLGVDCTYCHVEGKFELDDKPAKQTARKMLRMVGTIAREIYKGSTPVFCYTCHRGQTRPALLPPETTDKKQ